MNMVDLTYLYTRLTPNTTSRQHSSLFLCLVLSGILPDKEVARVQGLAESIHEPTSTQSKIMNQLPTSLSVHSNNR